MSVTRRTFLRQTLAFGPVAMTFWMDVEYALAQGGPQCTLPTPAQPQRFIPNEPRVLTRFSAAEMADPSRAAQLQQFRNALGLVRNLPSSNVISWTKQIAQHCLNCAPSNPTNIHYSWLFLPWHRGLLYFLERILRTQSRNDDLRLVYWDWESPQSRTLPSIYAPSGQPLYWRNRRLTGQNWPLANDDVDVQPLLAVPSFDVFGGTATQRQPVPASFSGPHATVHNAFAPGDMADLQYSPRDPVFYAHHGNIDRLWSSWVNAGHSTPDFGDARVYFYDENRQWRYVLMNDLREERQLGYQYSALMQPSVPVARLQAHALQGTRARFGLSPEARAVTTRAEGPQYLVIQNMQNLDQLPATTIRYGIFAGQPPVGTPSTAVRGFLGKAARVASSSHNHVAPLSVTLNVTGKLSALVTDNQGVLELTVAPLDAASKTTGRGIPLVADSIALIG